MISGSNSLPQKDVMDWVGARYYSFNSIIQALQNQKNKVPDNENLPVLDSEEKSEDVIIIGGGKSVEEHSQGLIEFLNSKPKLTVIHASSKNAALLRIFQINKFFV
jgi:4-hydroxy 2-oxovalerate aldolase